MSVPWAISFSAIVDPEMGLYDDLPDSCTADQMNAWILSRARQLKGAIGQKFVDLIEWEQSKNFKIEVTDQINDFIKQLNPKTKYERNRARAVALLCATGRLGIKRGILSWNVEKMEQVLRKLFAASCKSLPDPQAIEGFAIEKLRQRLREAPRLELSRRGHNLEFTAEQVKAADIYLEGKYMYIRTALFSEWLPGQEGELAINYLDKQSLLEKPLTGRKTKAVQKTIMGFRESFFGIDRAFLGEGFPAE
jgi:hypothetical protein